MRQIAGGFTLFFKRELGPDRFFEFNLEDVEALQEDKEKKAEIAIKLLEAGWSINEAREIFGKEPDLNRFADVPKPLVPKGNLFAEVPMPQPMPEPNNQVIIDDEGKISEAQLSQVLTKAGTNLNLQTKELDDEVDKVQAKFVGFVLDQFVDMAEVAIKVFKRNAKSYKPANLVIKVDNFDEAKFKKELQRAFNNLESQWVDETTDLLSSSVEFGYDSQLRFVLNEPGLDELTAIRTRDQNKRRLILEARNIRSFQYITDTQTEQVMKRVQAGIKNKLTIDQIAKDIADYYSDIGKQTARARTIARTETLSAVSQGHAAAIDDAKEVVPDLEKVWITANDERVRPTHVDNDRIRVKADGVFPNGLRYPRDPQGGASEVINCRCTIVMIPKDKKLGDF